MTRLERLLQSGQVFGGSGGLNRPLWKNPELAVVEITSLVLWLFTGILSIFNALQ